MRASNASPPQHKHTLSTDPESLKSTPLCRSLQQLDKFYAGFVKKKKPASYKIVPGPQTAKAVVSVSAEQTALPADIDKQRTPISE